MRPHLRAPTLLSGMCADNLDMLFSRVHIADSSRTTQFEKRDHAGTACTCSKIRVQTHVRCPVAVGTCVDHGLMTVSYLRVVECRR